MGSSKLCELWRWLEESARLRVLLACGISVDLARVVEVKWKLEQALRGRASALGMNNSICHYLPEKVVNIQHVTPSSCKPIGNHVYSRLLGAPNERDERSGFDGMLERNR